MMTLKNHNLKIKGLILTIGFLILNFGFVLAQDNDPVSWTIELASNESGGFELKFSAEIEDGWHLYSTNPTNSPDDAGPLPTEFVFEENEEVRFLNEIIEGEGLVTKVDDMFGIEVNYFEGQATFSQKIGVRKGKTTTINGKIHYMICDDQMCMMPDPQNIELVINNN